MENKQDYIDWLRYELIKFAKKCPTDKDGLHSIIIEGDPLSGKTWNVCKNCGLRGFRG
jgi:hypothetical protein